MTGRWNMYQKVLEKLKFEYESFVLDMTHTSRANIYANARQIMIKRTIYETLSIIDEKKFSEGQWQLMLAEHNLLDSLYLKMSDLPIDLQYDDSVIRQLELFVKN